MSTEVITSNCSSIEQKLEKARTNLKDLNENIKRIFGKNDNFRLICYFVFFNVFQQIK